jgi:ABC-type sugar transport system substrate-binding protein
MLFKSAIIGAVCVTAALALTGCGKDDAAKTGTAATSSNCGTVPVKAVTDSTGVIKTLGADYVAAYNGYAGTVQASKWADWKPAKTSGFTVGISVSQLSNPYQTLLNDALQTNLKAAGYKVIDLVSTNEVTNQIAQFNQLITDKVDLIVYQPLASGFDAVIDKAAAAGIPSISVLNTVPNPNTVSVVPNAYAGGAAQAAAIAKAMGGKGFILGVHGIKGVPIDTDTFNGAKAALTACPDITMDDSIYTDFSPTTAQTSVQQYLAANPTKTVGGVLEGGPMTTGIMAAFQKQGLAMPAIADNGLTKGGVAYWGANQGKYKGVGLFNPADGLATATTQVAKNMLDGRGVKVSDIIINPPLVTAGNLAGFSKSDFKTGDASTITVSDVSQPFASADYIDAFFGPKS